MALTQDSISYKIRFDIEKQNLNQLKASLQQIQKLTIKDVMKINNSDFDTAKRQLDNIKKAALDVEEALKKSFNAKLGTTNIKEFRAAIGTSQKDLQNLYNTFKQAGPAGQNAFRSLSSQVLNTNLQLKQQHTILNKIGTTLGNTIKWNAASMAINGITRGVQQAWGYVKNLDTSLNNIRIVTGKSADEMARFAKTANNVAQDLGRTTTDYTNAALIYAQQGLSDKEIQARSQITLKAANVTGQSTDEVSEELTAIWNGYKVNADQAEVYIDRVAAVAATTASDLEELATGMSKVAAAANMMGVNEEQLTAMLSTIISVTRQAPESVGTALRTVFARISDIKAGIDEDGVTLGNYSGKMAELGFNVLDATGNLRDMGEVIEEIGGRWQFLTREQQVSLAQTMAGQRQYSNLVALFDNFENYNKALYTAQNAAGTLQKQQDIYMDSTRAHLETLTAATQNIFDSFINTDAIESGADALATLANGAANFLDSIGGGGQLLMSLGSIAVNVFSNQIGRSLATTVTNFQMGKENARQFAEALNETQNWQGIKNLDPTTQKILDMRESMLSMVKVMTPESFQQTTNALNEFVNNGNELETVKSQFQAIKKELNSIQDNSFDKIFGNKKEMAEVAEEVGTLTDLTDHIESSQSAFTDVAKAAQEARNSIGKQGFVDQLNKLKTALTDLQNTQQSGQGFSEYKEGLQQLQTQIEKITSNAPGADQSLQNLLVRVSALANAGANAAGGLAQSLDNGSIQQVVQKIIAEMDRLDKATKKSAANFQQQMKQAFNASMIGTITKTIGQIGQLASAMRQLSNLKNIFTDKDLSPFEKFLQIVMNLGMSLPMMANGVAGLTGLLKNLRIGMLGTTAATTQQIVAEQGAKIATDQLNSSMKANIFIAIATAVLALVSALSSLIKSEEQLAKETVQANNKIIESENEKQKQIETDKQLLNSARELQDQYKEGIITRFELRDSIKQLTDEYEGESDAIKKLADRYLNLGDAIEEANLKAAEDDARSKKREFQASQANVLTQAGVSLKSDLPGDLLRRMSITNSYPSGQAEQLINETSNVLSLGTYDETNLDAQVFTKVAREIFGEDFKTFSNPDNPNQFSMGISIDLNDADAIADYVEKMQQVYTGMGDAIANPPKWGPFEMDSSDLQTSWSNGWLKSFIDEQLNGLNDIVDQYNISKKEMEDSRFDVPLFDAINSNKVDLDNIETVNDYLKQRKTLIEEITQLEDVSYKDAISSVDSFLSRNYKSISNKFELYGELQDNFLNRFGIIESSNQDNIFSQIENLDTSQLEFLIENQNAITSWEQLQTVLENIANIDFQNIKTITSETDIKALQQSASNRYSVLQDLEDQLKQGKSISSSEWKNLLEQADTLGISIEEFQSFFEITAKGAHKLKGDGEEFYKKLEEAKLSGFKSNYDTMDRQASIYQNFAKNGYQLNRNFDELTDYAFSENSKEGVGSIWIDGDRGKYQTGAQEQLLQDQLDYLDIIGDTNEALQQQVNIWRDSAEAGKLSYDQMERIAQTIKEQGDYTEDSAEHAKEIREAMIEEAHRLHDAMFPTDSDIEESQLSQMSKVIEGMAKSSPELADALESNQRDAEDVAQSILRFDNAIQDVVDNYEDWSKALASGSWGDIASVIEPLRDAYADLLDLQGSSLSEEFLSSAENLQLMKAAIDGNVDAYDQLLEKAGQDIDIQAGINTEGFQQDFDYLMDLYYKGQNLDDMEVGASLNDEGFLEGLNRMLENTDYTVQQATDKLASMGVDAQIIEQKADTKETKQVTGFQPQPNTEQIPYNFPYMNGNSLQFHTGYMTAPGVTYKPDINTVTTTSENAAVSLKVISAKKSSGGGFKFSKAKNGAGSAGQTRRANASKGSGGSGGNKGNSSQNKPDTSQKDLKKSLTDQRDLYHDINIQIKDINRELKRTQQQQDKLYGKELLKNLNKQTDILEKQKAKLKEKNELQKLDLANQRKILENLGVTFDQYGHIGNYMSILLDKQNAINDKIADYNKLTQAYNASTNKDAKSAINTEMDKVNKQISNAQNDLKQLQTKIKNYDSLTESMEDLLDEIEEITQKQIEINIKKFRMEIEIRLDMGEAERDWNDFVRNVINHSDVIKGTQFEDIFKDARQGLDDFLSYFDVHGSKGTIQALTEQLMATKRQIDAIDQTGKSAIYGTDKAQAMEDLQNDLDELMSQLGDMKDLIDQIDEAYLDTIDDIEDQFSKQIDDYEFIGELIQHDMDLLSLLYGDKNYDAMNKYYETLQTNQINQIDSLKQQRDFWKQQWDAAAAAGDTNAAQKFKENWQNVLKDLNSTIEEAAQTLQDKYSNAVNKIFDDLDKELTSGKGSDYLKEQWDLMNKQGQKFLDTINSAFAVQDLQSKFRQALNNDQSIKGQRSLNKLMNEQLEKLKNKDKLTQYDVDRAEKLLQIEQARLALENTRNNKTTLRLKRNSQGNYTYEYAADQDSVLSAQQELARLQNELYNFDKEKFQSNLDDAFASWQEFTEKIIELRNDRTLNEEEKTEREKLLRQQYSDIINGLAQKNKQYQEDLMESAIADYADLYKIDQGHFQDLTTAQQNMVMGQLVPTWESGINTMIEKIADQGGLLPITKGAFEELDQTTENYKGELDNLALAGGLDLEKLKDGVDENVQAYIPLVEENDQLLLRMQAEFDAIKNLRDQAKGLAGNYKEVADQAINAVGAIHNYMVAQQQQTLQAIELDKQRAQATVAIQAAMIEALRAGAASVAIPSYTASGTSGTGTGNGNSAGNNSSGPSAEKLKQIEDKQKRKAQSSGRSTGPSGGVNLMAMYATGGYTGDWHSDEGKFAVLHEKQLVLNKQDTKNVLDAVSILRSLMSNINGNIYNKMNGLNKLNSKFGYNSNGDALQQEVNINANFPNVNSKREIEEAFNDLVNLAAQRALR